MKIPRRTTPPDPELNHLPSRCAALTVNIRNIRNISEVPIRNPSLSLTAQSDFLILPQTLAWSSATAALSDASSSVAKDSSELFINHMERIKGGGGSYRHQTQSANAHK